MSQRKDCEKKVDMSYRPHLILVLAISKLNFCTVSDNPLCFIATNAKMLKYYLRLKTVDKVPRHIFMKKLLTFRLSLRMLLRFSSLIFPV